MARLIREAVAVIVSDGQPVAFTWRSRAYAIAEILDDWRDTGEWWAGEAHKDFWRVRTTSGGAFDLYCEPQSDRWTLYKAID